VANLNLSLKKQNTYDAIVIGSGMSGGWAAKELTEKGLRTLVLERGRDVKHIIDYPNTLKSPWEYPHLGELPLAIRNNYNRGGLASEDTVNFIVDNKAEPFIQEKPFRWVRGYHVGGKSLLWSRATQRWSDLDYTGPARDGFAVDWPIRYKDMSPWYDKVEKFAGIAGQKENLPQLPDGHFLPPFELSCIETHFKESIKKHFKGIDLIHGRCAHLTQPKAIHTAQGRGQCQNRKMCDTGCPYGGYFSANASTLPWAEKTGKLTLRSQAIVESILYDASSKKAKGVRIIDALSGEEHIYYAKIIFVNAGTINSNAVLLNSKSDRFPNGLGNDNGLMGKFLAFHNYRGKGHADHPGFKEFTISGKNPGHAYIPRFRNVHHQETDFLRGYSIGLAGYRSLATDKEGIGEQLKNNLLKPQLGPWRMAAWMQGETIPVEDNHLRLSDTHKDSHGIPQIILSAEWKPNDDLMVKDFTTQLTALWEKAGFTNLDVKDQPSIVGSDVHEMGGVRMGYDPNTSLLNKYNQLHHCKNVFVTDGACMTSTGTQNPSLTYMALTARAANYAVDQLNKKNL
jgi:choline dehydrogenase-like flavoprotein